MTYLLPALCGLLGLVAGMLVAARLAGRPFVPPWRWRCERPRDVLLPLVCAAGCMALSVRFGASVVLPAYLYLVLVGVSLAAIDVEQHRLPDVLTLPSYPIALALLGGAALVVPAHRDRMVPALIGMVALALLYLVLYVINPNGIGFGDVKLAGVLGAYLGWLSVDAWVVGTFLGVLFGGVFSVVLLLLRMATAKSNIPFGPFMIAGTLVAVLLSEHQFLL